VEKAFDLKALVARLQASGLPVAEDAAELLYKELSKWLSDSAQLHDNALVKAVLPPLLAVVDPLVLSQIDKIDKVVEGAPV
jgi:hypothetical protein